VVGRQLLSLGHARDMLRGVRMGGRACDRGEGERVSRGLQTGMSQQRASFRSGI
jgi:hypothetical protein